LKFLLRSFVNHSVIGDAIDEVMKRFLDLAGRVRSEEDSPFELQSLEGHAAHPNSRGSLPEMVASVRGGQT
jgi:hypothetical protein